MAKVSPMGVEYFNEVAEGLLQVEVRWRQLVAELQNELGLVVASDLLDLVRRFSRDRLRWEGFALKKWGLSGAGHYRSIDVMVEPRPTMTLDQHRQLEAELTGLAFRSDVLIDRSREWGSLDSWCDMGSSRDVVTTEFDDYLRRLCLRWFGESPYDEPYSFTYFEPWYDDE